MRLEEIKRIARGFELIGMNLSLDLYFLASVQERGLDDKEARTSIEQSCVAAERFVEIVRKSVSFSDDPNQQRMPL